MILVILAIAIVLFVGGIYINVNDTRLEDTGIFLACIGGFGTIITGIIATIMICECIGASSVDAKLDIYEAANSRIEAQIEAGVRAYNDFEYVSNANAIKELETHKIDIARYRWWLYFGE